MPTSFQESLETWTRSLLHEYVGQLEQAPVPEAAKEFNDPVWGTILIHPAEMLVLDSPLIQRLSCG
jgi:deoxynucleoside triphosphate triphosphohydrolase SAMHD1